MKTNWKRNALIVCCLGAGALLPTGCSLIDDDTDICLAEYDAEYELALVTNEEPEIARTLGQRSDIAAALRAHLDGVFTDKGRDLDLSSYNTLVPGAAPIRETHDMNGASLYPCHISLPVGNFHHVAVANSAAFDLAASGDTINSLHAALFSGRKELSAPVFGPYSFHMNLYTAVSGAALVLDPRTAPITGVKITTTGFASSFEANDSTYHFDRKYSVLAERVNLSDTTAWQCYCTVNLPSREPSASSNVKPSTRSRVDTDAPFLYDDCGEDIWSYEGFVSMKDGTVTHTTISIRHPLRAGQLKVIVGYIDDQGVIRLNENELGGAVDLKWEQGYIHEIHI